MDLETKALLKETEELVELEMLRLEGEEVMKNLGAEYA